MTDTQYTLIFDTDLKRPGCAIMQAIAGTGGNQAFRLFNPDSWLVNPTPGMKRITGTLEQWGKLAKIVNEETKR